MACKQNKACELVENEQKPYLLPDYWQLQDVTPAKIREAFSEEQFQRLVCITPNKLVCLSLKYNTNEDQQLQLNSKSNAS